MLYLTGGNAFNQLAVLSTYSEDDLAAVYYYFRSLAVAKPFSIARENLVLLLEQIRVKCLKLPQRAQPKGQAQKVPMKSKRPVNVLMHELSIRIAHLHGELPLPSCRQHPVEYTVVIKPHCACWSAAVRSLEATWPVYVHAAFSS